MVPVNAATLIDDLGEAERKMEQAGLLQLPFVIRQLSEQREQLKAKEQEAELLRQEIKQLQKPTLFVEGVHDVSLFQQSLIRLGLDEEVSVKPLGGTPQTADALLTAVLSQGGITPSAKTLFLFDDDKAGRGAAKKLVKSFSGSEPAAYNENTFVCVLERTSDFNLFLKRRSISTDQAFSTAEFLYPVADAAAICLELVEGHPSAETQDWKGKINGDYWPHVGQRTCMDLMSSEPGSADWFYARGVPNSLKGLFSEAALERGLDTAHVDAVVAKSTSVLLL